MMDKYAPLLSTIDELIAIYITDDMGNPLHTLEKKGISYNFERIIDITKNTINSFLKNYPKDGEVVIFFDRGTIYFRIFKKNQVLIILNTPKPSSLCCFVIKDFFKKLELEEKQPEIRLDSVGESTLINLSFFSPVVDCLLRYYGPAAKLMVKRALKNSGASNEGIPSSAMGNFISMLENEIMDVNLRPKIMAEIKDLLKIHIR